MAQLLDATQPAVHKYENGIMPEMKRLLKLARIGNTSIEWILTGRHWENGSNEMDRLDPEIYELAYELRSFTAEDRKILADALDLVKGAASALREASGTEPIPMKDADLASRLQSFDAHAKEALMAALAVYDAVVTTLASSKVRDLHRFGQKADEATATDRQVRVPALHKNAG